jgi:hypothetical protein
MSDEPNQINPNELKEKEKFSALALPLAFVPSVLLLILFTFFGSGNPPAILFFAFCGVSVVCCFGSAILLFRRNTVLAILFGILFLLLNGAISFFFGCVAVLSGTKF